MNKLQSIELQPFFNFRQFLLMLFLCACVVKTLLHPVEITMAAMTRRPSGLEGECVFTAFAMIQISSI